MINSFKILKDYMIISSSRVFDRDYYLYMNPDVRKKGINPIIHYIRYGSREGRNPAPYFDSNYYLSINTDVKDSKINPFLHWILHGFHEGRNPSPYYVSPTNTEVIKNPGKMDLFHVWLNNNSRGFSYKPKLKEISIYEEKIIIDNLYRGIFDRHINFGNPKTFNEKIQLYKLNYRKPLMTKLSDKLLVRNYIEEKLGKEYLIPLIGSFNKVNDIPFEELPNEFLLKANHGSGWNIVCWNLEKFNWENAKITINYWLGQNYYLFWREWSYKDITPKILIEKLIFESIRKSLPVDYKIYCFNGQPKMIMVRIYENFRYKAIYYDLEWRRLPFHKAYQIYSKPFPRPDNFEEMVYIAKKLSNGLPFVRVDMFITSNKIMVGELTFYPDAGFSKFYPTEWDDVFGSYFDISWFEK